MHNPTNLADDVKLAWRIRDAFDIAYVQGDVAVATSLLGVLERLVLGFPPSLERAGQFDGCLNGAHACLWRMTVANVSAPTPVP